MAAGFGEHCAIRLPPAAGFEARRAGRPLGNDIRGRNWILVNGQSLVSILDIPLLAPKITLTPYLNGLDPNNSTIIVGNSCIPNCIGKKCTEDNGCGQPCNCSPGFTCNSTTGNCDRIADVEPCKGQTVCGGNNGKCPGTCSNNGKCQRDVNGYFKCISDTTLGTNTLIFLIGIAIIIILIIAILIAIKQK